MSGSAAFASMSNILSRGCGSVEDKSDDFAITNSQLEEFDRYWVWYALRDWRYGQAFCEHFGLDNFTVLYHFKDNNLARRWIRDNYIRHEAEVG